MLKTLVLVCAATTPHADCSPATAIAAVRQPQQPGLMCGVGFGLQAALADTALRPEAGKSYAKIICTR